ncbi:MAG TPA: MFS transporter [Gemmatimonadales bacterium]
MRHRNYRLFFIGQGTSLIGTWLTRTATSWLVYRLSHSAMVLGWVSFASLIPAFLLSPFAGVFVDRWNRHRVLLMTQIASAVQSAGLAVLTLTGTITIPAIVALSVFQGLINAFDIPARQSLVSRMIEDRNDLPNAIALNSSMVNLARLVGPAFAGILIATVGEGGCFTIDAISYLAVIATLLMMRGIRQESRTAPRQHVLVEFREGLAYARRSRTIVAILLLLALVGFMGAPYMTLLPMIVTERLSGDARLLGYLTSASGLGALAGALMLASRRSVIGIERITAISAFIFGVGLILFGISHTVWFALPMIFLAGLGMMVQMASSNTILQTVSEESKLGRVMSLFAMAFMGMAPFGSLFGGLTAEKLGAAVTLEVGGVACCLGAVIFVRALPAIRREIRLVI